jgi:hypothetical protein
VPRSAVEVKWVFWALLSWVALAAGLIWCLIHIYSNSQYTLLGKAVNCVDRPHWEAMQRCNAARESVACMHETRTELAEWYSPIDYACSQSEPQRPFVFPAYNEPETLEIAEIQE